MDLSSVCRLCLAEVDEPHMFDMFEEVDDSCYYYSSVVKDIAGVEVDPDDQLSKFFCSTCRYACNDFVRFRELILSSRDYQMQVLSEQYDGKEEFVVDQISEVVQVTDIELDHIYEEEDESQTYGEEKFEEVETSKSEAEDFQIFYENITSADLVDTSSSEDEAGASPESNRKFFCDNCNKTFSSRVKLIQHIRVHSQKKKNYSCSVCQRKFPTEILLTRHEIVHSNLLTQIKIETMNRCLVCNETFKEKSELEDHMQYHKNQLEGSSIECIYCEKSYSKLSNLVRHLKTHEDNKTHCCNICSKTFAMGQELIDHLNKHKGFTPHACTMCDKSYMQLSNLRTHMKVHSNQKVSLI
jgi:Zinc-finger associated domain (zf-AD)/C2H2-type zinc finger/Zinc finger, C2H2 type